MRASLHDRSLDIDRFYSKTERQSNGCLLWTGANDGTQGYGRFVYPDRTSTVPAHIWIYEQVNGPVPDGMLLRHRCDTPPCVELEHLIVGTHADNAHDRDTRGRNGRSKRTHCKRGHEYTKENTHMTKSGRRCRACDREDWHRRKR